MYGGGLEIWRWNIIAIIHNVTVGTTVEDELRIA
jgi:hypothetical protein